MKIYLHMLKQWIYKAIITLSHKWNGIVGVFVLIVCNVGVAIGKNILKMVNETGDTVTMDHNLNFKIYDHSQTIIDSLQHQVDSLQALSVIHRVEQTRNVILFTENMQPVLIVITIIFSIMTGIGWYWKLCDRKEMKREKAEKKEAEKHKIIV